MAFPKDPTDVLVVGAGPAGLMAALRLAGSGVRVAVVDEHWRTGAHSYALGLHPATLRLLDGMGLADELISLGRRVERVAFYDGTRRRCEISYAPLGGKFPFLLVLPQSLLESALESRLNAKKLDVLWNHRVQSLDPAGGSATIATMERVATGYPIASMDWAVGKTFEARASWIVGADGFRSCVREGLGLRTNPIGKPATYALYELEGAPDHDEVRVVLDGHGTSVLWPMQQGRSRWSFQVTGPAPAQDPADQLQAFLRRSAPWFSPGSGTIRWSSGVAFVPRLADGYGKGMTWLAGDAAHMAGPVGVHSMNMGLLEAADLADRIAGVQRGQGTAGQLAEYGTRWMSAWRSLMNLDNTLSSAQDADPWVESEAQRILPCLPATGDDLAKLLTQIGLSQPSPAAQ
jgi:2-polyprenyl-6-methoxyphenol hydroxylase-like FAD-dependent oxidoreductase